MTDPIRMRALVLFREQHLDFQQAWMIATSEARDRARQQGQHLDADEPKGRIWIPHGIPHQTA